MDFFRRASITSQKSLYAEGVSCDSAGTGETGYRETGVNCQPCERAVYLVSIRYSRKTHKRSKEHGAQDI